MGIFSRKSSNVANAGKVSTEVNVKDYRLAKRLSFGSAILSGIFTVGCVIAIPFTGGASVTGAYISLASFITSVSSLVAISSSEEKHQKKNINRKEVPAAAKSREVDEPEKGQGLQEEIGPPDLTPSASKTSNELGI